MRYARPIRLPTDADAHPDHAFHLIVRTHPEVGKLLDTVRGAIWATLLAQRSRQEVDIHASVLMPDHAHIIASPGSIDIVRWVGHWKSISTRAAWGAGHSGVVWQRRFYDRGLRGADEFDVAMEYVLRNPSEAGLIEDDDVWPHRWAWWFEG